MRRCWKVGTRWDEFGKQGTSIFESVFLPSGLIFATTDKCLQISEGDLFAVADGYTVIAIAEALTPGFIFSKLRSDNYSPVASDYVGDSSIFGCKVRFYILNTKDAFKYKKRGKFCQAGDVVTKIVNNLFKKCQKYSSLSSNLKNTIPLSLQEIADWQLASRDKVPHNACWAKLPSFQRGRVWSPAQIEVLWDSLMRGIPIGALSLLPIEGHERFRNGGADEDLKGAYWVVDGQQRSNAIALGFSPFPSQNDSILWLDLLPDRSIRMRRKFFFYVTTPGRPWGYCVTKGNDERSCEKVPVDEHRRVMREELNWDQGMGSKPPTYKFWPVEANLPVPFSKLRELGRELNLEKVVEVVRAEDAEWARHFQRCLKKYEAEQDFRAKIDEELRQIKEGLDQVCDAKTIGLITYGCLSGDEDQNQEADENSNLAVYFSRLNQGGTPPKGEDLDYSILKSIVPELSVIDKYAANDDAKSEDVKKTYLMHPSRLANIAMLTYLSLGKWKNALNRSDIYKLQTDESFRQFILPAERSQFKDALVSVRELLEYSSENKFGLPTVLYSSLTKDNQRLFRFLILLAIFQKKSGFSIDREMLIAFVTIVSWFGRDDDLEYEKLYDLIRGKKQSDEIFMIIAEWIGNQIENEMTRRNRAIKRIELPPRVKDLERIRDALSKKDLDLAEKACNPPGYSNGLNCLWDWKSVAGRGFLLYACRCYLANTFTDYDPASAVWNEDDRPWDYDHIIPQRWLQQGKGNKKGPHHDVVKKFLMSIGNIAPVPFSINRSKNDAPPGDYLGEKNNEMVFIDFRGIDGLSPFFIKDWPKKRLEDDKTSTCNFAYMTTVRWIALYKEWLRLPVFELLSKSFNAERKEKITAIQHFLNSQPKTKGRAARIVYHWLDGKQYDVEEAWDWTRPWIACGVDVSFQRSDKKRIPCFLSACVQNGRFEVGLRRSPESNNPIDDHNEWWIVAPDELFIETDSVNEAIAHLEKMLERPDIVLR